MASETIEIRGHIVDSLLLAKILDSVLDAGFDYEVVDFEMGRSSLDPSAARIVITGDDEQALEVLVDDLQVHGANRVATGEARLVAADRDGVLPGGFYSTTNLVTHVRLDGRWVEVDTPEMDCAVVASDRSARTVPMHRVKAGDLVVVGAEGVRVEAPAKASGDVSFEFMSSEVSSEKPKALLIEQIAGRLRATRAAGRKVMFVCGPAVVHTGGASELARMVHAGWVDVLVSGNGFAVHDMEAAVLGTSLGVSVTAGEPTEGGHANHLRLINEVRRHGSIAGAVEAGYVTSGVMHACVVSRTPFLLGGSVRDDGPLPDTITDVVEATDALRTHVPGVGAVVMLASTLHGIATGNCLPATVETFCVDINQAVVTKLSDRGTHQAVGVVTDVGPFVSRLAAVLLADT